MTSHNAAIERQAMADALRRCGPWFCTDDDAALVVHAEQQADHIDRVRMAGGDAAALDAGTRRITAHGLDLPDAESERGQVARLCCGIWWRRQLRRLNSRRLEQSDRILGRVHDRAGIYVSNRGYRARRTQQSRNARMLEAVTATNELGQEYTLAELSELGLANPENRRAELMLRIADTEREAMRLGHVGVFVTITCPSRFHAVHRGTARHNPKWTAAECPDPREAQAYLQKLWSRARAKLGRKHLGLYGIRVVEPHHDGSPHWHLLLWTEGQNVGAVLGLLRGYALADSPEEVTKAERIRFDAKLIDPKKGSAAGYVAKYISKNINGSQFADADHYGQDMRDSAPRIEAWAATWGIRQFQFFGLPSVTVWRELRRMRDASAMVDWLDEREPDAAAMLAASDLRRAADDGRWADYLRAMGGPMTKRDDQPARPWGIEKMRGQGGELQTGRYGEPLATTIGVRVLGFELLTKSHRWTTERRQAPAFDLEGLTFDAPGVAWTGVNNCTPDLPAPETSPLSNWEWHVTESIRRMIPTASPDAVEDAYRWMHHQNIEDRAREAKAKAAARQQLTDRQADKQRREQGRRLLAGWLLDGTITPNDLTHDHIEELTA